MSAAKSKKTGKSAKALNAIETVSNTEQGTTEQPQELKAQVRQLSIKNYGCISDEVTIELDKIVVLVGVNNSGKSTVLNAYNLIMGSESQQKLSEQDMCEGNLPPEITLVTQILSDHKPGERWLDREKGNTFKERWLLEPGGKPMLIRQGYDYEKGDFVRQVPYGAEGYAKWHRPKPHYISAFDSPDQYEKKINELLQDIIFDNIQAIKLKHFLKNDNDTQLAEHFGDIAKLIIDQTEDRIVAAVNSLRSNLAPLFPSHSVQFHKKYPDGEDMIKEFLKLLNKGIGFRFSHHEESFHVSLQRQGSGAQRMLMFAIVKYLAESSSETGGRSHILLLDEPEICLHPSVIREMSRNLYDLAQIENWQVMISTHSPVFLDLSRDNTTIVRLERATGSKSIAGTTVFRRDKIELEGDDPVQQLKMLNYCDSYVTEFFFGGITVLVEGDTEYASFRFLLANFPGEFGNVHVIRARGKDSLCLLVKILNAFGAQYSVLHDCDRQRSKNGDKNSAFSGNERIFTTASRHAEFSKVFLVAIIPDFEQALFGKLSDGRDGKAFFAVDMIRKNAKSRESVKQLLLALTKQDVELLPKGCKRWSRLEELHQGLADFDTVSVHDDLPLFRNLPAPIDGLQDSVGG